MQKLVKHLLVASKDIDTVMQKENIYQCINTTIMETLKNYFASPLKKLGKKVDSAATAAE